MNTEAAGYVAAYVGGVLIGTFGTALAVNKLREKFDPNYRPKTYYPSHDSLVQEIMKSNK